MACFKKAGGYPLGVAGTTVVALQDALISLKEQGYGGGNTSSRADREEIRALKNKVAQQRRQIDRQRETANYFEREVGILRRALRTAQQATAASGVFDLKMVTRLVRFCHPDRHAARVEEATSLTQVLNGERARLRR